jgi:two-component system sensor histidine kinase VicK
MEPGVPFSLLGAVQLLLIAALGGLAVTALLRRSTSAGLIAVGAVLLAAVEVRTALRIGVPTSDTLALLRAAGGLLIGVGFLTGGLGSRTIPTSLYGVVVPLAAALGPSSLSAASAAFAAGAIVWARRDEVALCLAVGFGLLAVANMVSFAAGEGGTAPAVVLVLRGAAALAVLLALGLLAQASLLSKVVGAILIGVITMAVAAVGVVGNVVVTSYEKQSRETVEEAALGRLSGLTSLGEQNKNQAVNLSAFCASGRDCQGYLQRFLKNAGSDFVVLVKANREVTSLGGRPALTRAEQLGLVRTPVVDLVLRGAEPQLYGGVRLTGARPSLAVVGVAVDPLAPRPTGQSPPPEVYVYGTRLDNGYVSRDIDAGGFGLSFLAGDRVTATNLSSNNAERVRGIVRAAEADGGIPDLGETIGSQGANPTVRVVPIRGADQQAVGLLALSRDPGPALQAERDALRLLMVTALLAMLAVAITATLLGRRTVRPVQDLTEAAERIAGGDLTATTAVRSKDEVGTLSRTFATMTASLGQLTGDLRESAEQLETVLASMSDGLLATDEDGLVTNVNRAALEMLDLEVLDVLGEHLSVVADVRDSSGRQLANPELRIAGEPADVHRANGLTVPVRVDITSLLDAGGVVLILRDTTREREVERMKTEFLSNVSHELRTPLTPIRGYADMLVGRPNLDGTKVVQFAGVIRDEAVKMNRVVDLLVDVAAFEAGRVTVTPRPLSVRELFDSRLEVWKNRAPVRQADFKRRIATGLPHVNIDPIWVAKALDELIDNAVKYSPVGAAITLVGSWSPDGSRVRVSVKDAGPGISEKDLGGLFTSFEQVDGSATRRVGGLGLGLSFVRRLADDFGLPVTVLTRPGKGAEFSLDLPVADAPAPRRTGKKKAPARKP